MREAAALLEEGALGAGLAWPLTPWSSSESLAERLASNPFVMAPMAGVSDRAWRLMARAGGATTAYSEMVSAAGLHFASEKTWELVIPDANEPELAVQLFGSDPALFEEAAAKVAARLGRRLAFLDVNMACPVAKVVRKGEGVALMDDAPHAEKIMRACRAGLDKAGVRAPLTAKIRLGRTPERPVFLDFAKALEDAGASAVAVHGRFGSQGYAGTSSISAIAEVATALAIPVLASGDALSPRRSADLLRESGAKGVLIARGSYGNPWIFSDARRLLQGEEVPVHSPWQRLSALELHLRLLEATGEHMLKARQISCHYLRGLPGAADARRGVMRCATLDEFLALIEGFGEELARRQTTP